MFSCDFVQTINGVYQKEGEPPAWSIIRKDGDGAPEDPSSWHEDVGRGMVRGKWPVMNIDGYMNRLCPPTSIGVMFQKKNWERKILVVLSPVDLCQIGGNLFFCSGCLLLLGEEKD